jgi:hypothetical protein
MQEGRCQKNDWQTQKCRIRMKRGKVPHIQCSREKALLYDEHAKTSFEDMDQA